MNVYDIYTLLLCAKYIILVYHNIIFIVSKHFIIKALILYSYWSGKGIPVKIFDFFYVKICYMSILISTDTVVIMIVFMLFIYLSVLSYTISLYFVAYIKLYLLVTLNNLLDIQIIICKLRWTTE